MATITIQNNTVFAFNQIVATLVAGVHIVAPPAVIAAGAIGLIRVQPNPNPNVNNQVQGIVTYQVQNPTLDLLVFNFIANDGGGNAVLMGPPDGFAVTHRPASPQIRAMYPVIVTVEVDIP